MNHRPVDRELRRDSGDVRQPGEVDRSGVGERPPGFRRTWRASEAGRPPAAGDGSCGGHGQGAADHDRDHGRSRPRPDIGTGPDATRGRGGVSAGSPGGRSATWITGTCSTFRDLLVGGIVIIVMGIVAVLMEDTMR